MSDYPIIFIMLSRTFGMLVIPAFFPCLLLPYPTNIWNLALLDYLALWMGTGKDGELPEKFPLSYNSLKINPVPQMFAIPLRLEPPAFISLTTEMRLHNKFLKFFAVRRLKAPAQKQDTDHAKLRFY